jgi:hypothetical protein
MPHRTSRVFHQDAQGLVFFRREVQLLSRLLDAATARVEHEIPHNQWRIGRNGCDTPAANGCSEARGQFADLKGLRNVVACPGIQRLDDILFLIPHRKHDDRQARKALGHSLACFFAAHARHVDVQENSVIIDHSEFHERILAVVCISNGETQSSKRLKVALPDARIILGD